MHVERSTVSLGFEILFACRYCLGGLKICDLKIMGTAVYERFEWQLLEGESL